MKGCQSERCASRRVRGKRDLVSVKPDFAKAKKPIIRPTRKRANASATGIRKAPGIRRDSRRDGAPNLMNMQELKVELARVNEQNAGFARILCALAGARKRIVVSKAALDAVPPLTQLMASVAANGDVIFEVKSAIVIPMEGPAIGT